MDYLKLDNNGTTTASDRLENIFQTVQDKILENEYLVALLASKTDDLSDIENIDCPSKYVNKNIFFTCKNFKDVVENVRNLLLVKFKTVNLSKEYYNITVEFIILVHNELEEMVDGKKRFTRIARQLELMFEGKRLGGIGEMVKGNMYDTTAPSGFRAFIVPFTISDFKRNIG